MVLSISRCGLDNLRFSHRFRMARFFSPAPIDVGTRLELFVDPYLIATLDNIRLELHTPCRAGVA